MKQPGVLAPRNSEEVNARNLKKREFYHLKSIYLCPEFPDKPRDSLHMDSMDSTLKTSQKTASIFQSQYMTI